MQRWRRALVTGASSGIGDALARRLAADGTALVAVARDEARLTALRDALDVECEVLVADLTDGAARERVAGRLRDDDAPVDLLVNNAGLGFVGPFHSADPTREATVVDVNLVAVHRLAQAAASAFVRRGTGGGILNVSSLAAFMPMPDGATYAATKAFVNSMSEALHTELKPYGIHVTALCPGFTRTEMQTRADFDVSHIPAWMWQSAGEVAAAGLAGVAVNRPLVIPGRLNRMGATFVKALPAVLRRAAVAWISR